LNIEKKRYLFCHLEHVLKGLRKEPAFELGV
jgi:hypothetical protein